MNLYDQKMSKYSTLTKLVDGTCVRQNPKTIALSYTTEDILKTIEELKELYSGHNWRNDSVIEAYVLSLELKKVPAQERVKAYLKLNNGAIMEQMRKLFNSRTLESMENKGLIVTEGKSRLRTDDMEMVYWTEVRLVTKIEEALK